MRRSASGDPIASRAARLATYGRVSTYLTSLDDQRLGGLLDRATPTGTGFGGASMVLELEDAPVFVKCVALTDLDNVANTFMNEFYRKLQTESRRTPYPVVDPGVLGPKAT